MITKTMKLSEINAAGYNPRKDLKKNDSAYKSLKRSMDEYGFIVPLIYNEQTKTLISGHQRLKVLKDEGKAEAEVVIVDMDETKEKALCVAMNKISGNWDYGALADIIEEFQAADFSTELAGFSEADIKELFEDETEPEDDSYEPEAVTIDRETEGVPVRIGEYDFEVSQKTYDDTIVDIREKVGMTVPKVCEEIKRRLLA